MSISLQKRSEKVGIVLAKRGMTKVRPVRVGAAFDISGSAEHFYRSSVMQETIDRLIPVAMKFDDDGQLDAWLFHHGVIPVRQIVESDEGSFVKKVILPTVNNSWGATSYQPVLKEVMDYYFGNGAKAKPEKKGFFGGMFGKPAAPVAAPTTTVEPAMLMFITDGANDDEIATEQLMISAAANSPVYFNVIGVGNPRSFSFIQRMADELPNVGFSNLNDLSISDDQLYELLVNQEFVDWLKKFPQA